jgi:hypothetical protein
MTASSGVKENVRPLKDEKMILPYKLKMRIPLPVCAWKREQIKANDEKQKCNNPFNYRARSSDSMKASF